MEGGSEWEGGWKWEGVWGSGGVSSAAVAHILQNRRAPTAFEMASVVEAITSLMSPLISLREVGSEDRK